MTQGLGLFRQLQRPHERWLWSQKEVWDSSLEQCTYPLSYIFESAITLDLVLLLLKEKFNVTQGMTLLLLKKISLPSNLVFQVILFITNPENDIGYED